MLSSSSLSILVGGVDGLSVELNLASFVGGVVQAGGACRPTSGSRFERKTLLRVIAFIYVQCYGITEAFGAVQIDLVVGRVGVEVRRAGTDAGSVSRHKRSGYPQASLILASSQGSCPDLSRSPSPPLRPPFNSLRKSSTRPSTMATRALSYNHP
jgi:hypothetical protein